MWKKEESESDRDLEIKTDERKQEGWATLMRSAGLRWIWWHLSVHAVNRLIPNECMVHYQAVIAWSKTQKHIHDQTHGQACITHINPQKKEHTHTLTPCKGPLPRIYGGTHINTLWQCLPLTHTQIHTIISMLWQSAVRAAEEDDEYVFGKEQKRRRRRGNWEKERRKER